MKTGEGQIRVLLVDDQRIIAEAIKRLLDPERDMLLAHCQEPENALAVAKEFSPDVILQDLVMPGVDGLSLVQAYKSDPQLGETPVIVLSSEENAEVKIKAFSLSASDYMVKIPHRVELVARIRSHAKAVAFRKKYEAASIELAAAKTVIDSAAWLDSTCRAAASIVRGLEAPIHYVASNLLFIGDAFRSLTRFRARLARLPIPPELVESMKAAADAEDLDFVFDDAPKALRQCQDEAGRAEGMIRSIRSFPLQPMLGDAVSLDVCASLKDALSLLKERVASVAEVKISAPDGLPKAAVREAELSLSLSLLLLASASAIEARFGKNGVKGVIEISLGFDAGSSRISIAFKDDGQAIEASEVDGLFSPVYVQSGKKLNPRRGFFAVRHFAESSGGSFEVKFDNGACVCVLSLPSEFRPSSEKPA